MNQSPIITALLSHVTSECRAVDTDRRYDEMLDEVHGDFMGSYPASRVLKEVDPTAYHCGMSDWLDSESVTEVEGSYYDDRDLDEAKTAFVEEKEAERATADNELDELEGEPAEEADAEAIEDKRKEVARLDAELAELEAHSF